MKRAEQVQKLGHGIKRGETPSGISKSNGWRKRQAARARRRAERLLGADTPPRFTRSWGD